MRNAQHELDELLRLYRAACPDPEPTAGFTPGVWQKIEARRSFWLLFERIGRPAMTASALACLVLLILNLVTAPGRMAVSTYADALAADHTAETTYYAEAIRSAPAPDEPMPSGAAER